MEFEVVEKGRGEGDGREGREEGRGKAGCDFLRQQEVHTVWGCTRCWYSVAIFLFSSGIHRIL